MSRRNPVKKFWCDVNIGFYADSEEEADRLAEDMVSIACRGEIGMGLHVCQETFSGAWRTVESSEDVPTLQIDDGIDYETLDVLAQVIVECVKRNRTLQIYETAGRWNAGAWGPPREPRMDIAHHGETLDDALNALLADLRSESNDGDA